MSRQAQLSEPIDGSILRELNDRVITIQDAARGIPQELITEYESAQRDIERAMREGSEEIRRSLKRAEAVSAKFAHTDDELHIGPPFRRPTIEEIVSILNGQLHQVCGVRDFVLPFINGRAEPVFGTAATVTTVQQGVVGWGDHSNPRPRIVNTGSGDGQLSVGNLDLYWRAAVPHDGIFALRANQTVSSFPVFGDYRVRGSGAYFSSNDARIQVHTSVIIYLGTQLLEDRHAVIASDATRSENRRRSFGTWVNLPGRITFQASAGQELGMMVRLYCETWANDEGLAEVSISLFGLPANLVSDMHIDVVD